MIRTMRVRGVATGGRESFVAGLIAFVLVGAVSHFRETAYNNYTLLADAFLHGRAWIHWPGAYLDALLYHGKYYVIEAPLPAILLMPFVAFFGLSGSYQATLAAALAGVSVAAAWEFGRRAHLKPMTNLWLCTFLLLGTDLFWCAMSGAVWFLAHVSAVAFTMLTLLELEGERRPRMVALWAACAAGSRFTLVLVIPIYACMLLADSRDEGRRWSRVLEFAATLVPFAILWVAYNEARWGLPYDVGYTAWYHQDSAGSPTGSPFRLEYLPNQIHSFFQLAPQLVRGYPYVQPTQAGVALTWTSPALLLALCAKRPRRWVIGLWSATFVTMVPNLLYYVNGAIQFGMRHALDFEPFLFVLMVLASQSRMPRWGVVLCAYSALVGMWGIWFWKEFYSPV